MKVETRKASGVVLHWLVGTAEGMAISIESVKMQADYFRGYMKSYADGSHIPKEKVDEMIAKMRPVLRILNCSNPHTRVPNYSTDWAEGGPISERERISSQPHGDVWWATKDDPENPEARGGYGETELLAKMRCYVGFKLGDVVDVPDVLFSGDVDVNAEKQVETV